jgi:hypothetical protein
MLKKINRSDVILRPFNTFKKWNLDTTNTDTILLTENGGEILTYKVTSSCTYVNSGALSLQNQYWDSLLYSQEGLSIPGIFFDKNDPYYNAQSNPLNWNGTYKRITYSSLNKMFYSNLDNPLKMFGVEYADESLTGQKEIRNINNRAVVLNIAQPAFGEKIRPSTVNIYDYSNHDDVYYIVDDGYTNLFLSGSYFSSFIQDIQPPLNFDTQKFYDPTHERFGSSVSAYTNYVLVGCPMDSSSMAFPQAGAAFLYRIDPDTGNYRFIKKMFSPFTQNGFAEEQAWDSSNILMSEIGFYLLHEDEYSYLDKFGSTISINNDFIAIGAPQASYCGESGSAGQVFVYDKYKGGFDHWGIINILEGSASMDNFGCSVHLSGSKLAIGADGAYNSAGAVYIFERYVYGNTIPTSSFWYKIDPEKNWCEDIFREAEFLDTEIYAEMPTPYFITGNNTWILQHVITSSEWLSGENYGGTVRLDSDRLFVGSKNTNQSSSVYIFNYDINAVGTGIYDTSSFDGPEGNLAFGTGSWVNSFKLTDQGVWSASLFTPHSSSLLQEFNFFYPTAVEDVAHNDTGFGFSIDARLSNLIIGSPFEREFSEYSGSPVVYRAGAAYLFEFSQNTWELQYKWIGENKDSLNNRFGWDVSINSNRVSVSSPSTPYNVKVLFNTSSNSFEVEDYFGGAVNALDDVNLCGKDFLYKFNPISSSWSLEKDIKRVKYDQEPKKYFGGGVSLTEKNLFVGAPVLSYPSTGSDLSPEFIRYHMPLFNSGSVYVYQLSDLDNTYQIGNVFYKNGIITNVATQSQFINIFQGNVVYGKDSRGFSASYKGQHTIYESEVICSIDPGEFNISTNPTAVYRNPILFDINQDGQFDLIDVDLIMKYFQKNFIFVTGSMDAIEFRDDFTLETETGSWWKEDMFLLESEDTILLESWVSSSYTEQQSQIIQLQTLNQEYYNRIKSLDDAGYLDVDLNGISDVKDANLILRYFLGYGGAKLTAGLLDNNSQRKYSNDIKEYLDFVTGASNGIKIKEEFLNYEESSSLDKTGSYLAPYATTVGLYQDSQLVAVAKLAHPIKMSGTYPINFAIRIDR